ncbi:MAG: hypothetical protein CMO01_07030 [Thalassobius sp.]|nr:hypothetical protein [Thalassovita sp.]
MREPELYEQSDVARVCKQTDELFKNYEINFRKSLSPEKREATTYYELGRDLYFEEKDEKLCLEFCEIFHEVTKTELYHFPRNIFWDMDFIFFSAYREMKDMATNYGKFLEDFLEIMQKLLDVFGGHSTIKFQYIHDFSYGFDWAKWVKKDKANRKNIGPFSLRFLNRMFHRGEELVELIKQNDAKYYQLGKKENYRNPFNFRREPNEETALLEHLARAGDIPVFCWDKSASPQWQTSFDIKRKIASQQLGIVK